MAIILALDTSSDACSVALWRDGVIDELYELSPRSHTQRLLPMVDELLSKNSIKGSAIDAIAFGAGPGSFTGLRIGLGVVQGLAFGWKCKVLPVSTLKAMALGVKTDLNLVAGQSVLVALDARMSEVYAGLYTVSESGLETAVEDAVLPPGKVADSFDLDGKTFIAAGPGWHYPEMPEMQGQKVNLEVHAHARDVAILAAQTFAQGEAIEPQVAEPIYLRNTVSWKKREKKRL